MARATGDPPPAIAARKRVSRAITSTSLDPGVGDIRSNSGVQPRTQTARGLQRDTCTRCEQDTSTQCERQCVQCERCAVRQVFSPPQRKALKPVVEEGNMPRILSLWPPRMQLAGARGAIRCVVAVAFASSARARCVPEPSRLHLARAHGVILGRRVCS